MWGVKGKHTNNNNNKKKTAKRNQEICKNTMSEVIR